MSVSQLPSELVHLARVLSPPQFLSYLFQLGLAAPAVLRSRSLAAADGRMRGTFRFKTRGAPISIDFQQVDAAVPSDPTYSFSLARELYSRDVYLGPFAPFDGSGSTVIDLGANRGLFSVLACAALSPAKLIAIEPQEFYGSAFELLLAPYRDTCEIVLLHALAGGMPDLPIRTLSDPKVVDLNQLLASASRVSLAKIDIEGAEEALFTQNLDWLQRVERVAMETHPEFCDVASVHRALEKNGFTVRATDQYGHAVAAAKAAFFYAARKPDWLRS